MKDTENKLREAFIDALGIKKDQIADELAYQGIPEWDSRAHMALIAILEQEFEIMLDTDDILGMSSFKIARETLQKHGVEFA